MNQPDQTTPVIDNKTDGQGEVTASTIQPETQQIVIFSLDQEEFAVPILEVSEILTRPQITPVPDSQPYVLGVINVRGKIVPVIDLEKRFNLERSHQQSTEHVIIAEKDQGTECGIQVDQVTEVLRVSSENLKPAPSLVTTKIANEFIKGVVVIDDRMMLLLDISKILEIKDIPKPVELDQKESLRVTPSPLDQTQNKNEAKPPDHLEPSSLEPAVESNS